ncbi:hypothetical protein Enr8_02600 [Blastopirellula retiformator]|uniref:Dockerin domain-containing protein n=2 Tax=Blastopirellula retiformator TaxID=2527970 RepID=A0A5C5VKT1_9BACT|nr:hypothetical protein Enr8_02600 [Blastopirellula retiformator]
MRRIHRGNTLRLRRLYVRREASIESLETRAMLAADFSSEMEIGADQWGPTFLARDADTALPPRSGGFLLEGEDVVDPPAGDPPLADPPPVLLHFSVVTDPTQFDDAALGAVEQLPESMLHTHEWDRYYVEVWVEAGEQINDLSVDLNYETEITSPRHVTFGPAFADGNYAVDDDLGELRNIAAHIALPPPQDTGTAGAGDPGAGDEAADDLVLFARIEFGASELRDNVRLDLATGTVGPHSLELDMVRSDATTLDGQLLDVRPAVKPDFGLVPVIYDLDDDQAVSLVDLQLMIRSLGKDASAPNGQLDWYADFNKDYSVSLVDLNFMVRSIGRSWRNEDIEFPSNYPEAWIPEPDDGSGGGGTGGPGGTDPGDGEKDPPEDPPLKFVPIDVGGNMLAPDPAMILALQAILQAEIVFPIGFDFTLLQGSVSYSDGDGDGDKETMLEIEVDDQLFETEIEIEIMNELIDTDQLWSDWSGAISSYFGEAIADLKDLFLSDED